jgi:hypothetical protein
VAILSSSQRADYDRDGFLLVSGLIPAEMAAAAEEAMWDALSIDRKDPSTWNGAGGQHRSIPDPRLTAVYTDDFLRAAAELSGDEDPSLFTKRDAAYAINVFPQAGPWQWPKPHIDHAIKEHGHKTFPRAFKVATMTFLSDVPAHGAGTVVWPGSHLRIEGLAKSDPERYEMMWILNQELDRAGIGDPVELTPRRGDVLFYHYLCAHAGSMNTSDRPRFALNMKW